MLLFFLNDPGDRLVVEYGNRDIIPAEAFSNSLLALDRMWRQHDPNSQLGLSRLRDGSTIADLVPILLAGGVAAYGAISVAVTLSEFVEKVSNAIKAYSKDDKAPPRIAPPAFFPEDIAEFLEPLIKGKGGLAIKSVKYTHKNDQGKTSVEVKFTEQEVVSAYENASHDYSQTRDTTNLLTSEAVSPREETHHQSGLNLVLDQVSRDPGKLKGRTRDKGIISDISDSALPIYFEDADLKQQMLASGISPLQTRFDVDVVITTVAGRPKSYTVTSVNGAFPMALQSG